MLSWHVVGVGDLLSGLRCAVVRRSVRTAGTDWALTFEFSTLNVGGCRSLPFSGRGPGCPLYLRNGRSSVSRPDGDHLSQRRSASGSSYRLPAAAPDPLRKLESGVSMPESGPPKNERDFPVPSPSTCGGRQRSATMGVSKSHQLTRKGKSMWLGASFWRRTKLLVRRAVHRHRWCSVWLWRR